MYNCPACNRSQIEEREFKNEEKFRFLLQCNHCGHAYDKNYLTSEQGYAQGDYGLVDGKIPQYDRDLKLATTLISSFLIRPGDRILDYGAGWGGLSLRISQISNEHSLGIDVNCFEPVQRLGEFIRNKDPSITVHSNIENCVGNDFVIAKEVIEHSNNPKVLLETLAKTMNSGASLLITCPGHSHALEDKPGNSSDYQVNNHLHFFTSKSFESLVNRTGMFDLRTIALLDQYPKYMRNEYSDQQKSNEILRALSRRVNSEVNHLQVLLRMTKNT